MKYGWLFDSTVKTYGRASRRLLRDRAFRPIQTYIEVTPLCNLRCSFCIVGERFDSEFDIARRAETLTTDEWRDVIDQLYRPNFVTFTGGEPFLRSDTPELIEHACRRHRCHVITNATLIEESVAAKLVDMRPRRPFGPGLLFIGVSLQGAKQTHDAVTGRTGSFDAAVSAIRHVEDRKRQQAARWPRFHITTVISSETIHDLPEIVSTAADLGVAECNFPLEYRGLDETVNHTVNLSDFYISPPEITPIPEDTFRDIYARTEQVAREKNVAVRWTRMPLDHMVDFCRNRFNPNGYTCYTPWTKLYLNYYGMVHACHSLEMGNVRKQTVRDIWNGEKFRAFRRRLIEQDVFPVCAGCCELHKSPKR